MKILIADGCSIFCHGFKILFEEYEEIEEVTIYDDKMSWDEMLLTAKFDIVIMEIETEEATNLELGQNIKQKMPNVVLAFVTWSNINGWQAAVQKTGATALISKRALPDELLEIFTRTKMANSKNIILF